MTGNPDRSLTIDTHHHILPDFFWQATENAQAPVGGLAPLQWSKEASISFMDDAGIDVAVVSLNTPGVHTGDSAKARAVARRCNEFSAELVRSRPHPFGGFAWLPVPDVDASLEELSCNRAVAQMHYTNRFARTPNVRYVCSHAGGSIPYLAARFAIIDEMGFIAGRRAACSACCPTWQESIQSCMATNSKQRILQSSELNDLERRAILGGNASRLFPAIRSFAKSDLKGKQNTT